MVRRSSIGSGLPILLFLARWKGGVEDVEVDGEGRRGEPSTSRELIPFSRILHSVVEDRICLVGGVPHQTGNETRFVVQHLRGDCVIQLGCQPDLGRDGRIVSWVEVVAPEVEAVEVPLAAIEVAVGGVVLLLAVAAVARAAVCLVGEAAEGVASPEDRVAMKGLVDPLLEEAAFSILRVTPGVVGILQAVAVHLVGMEAEEAASSKDRAVIGGLVDRLLVGAAFSILRVTSGAEDILQAVAVRLVRVAAEERGSPKDRAAMESLVDRSLMAVAVAAGAGAAHYS